MKTVVALVGVLATLMGLLWIGQGLGLVHWPASSFMIAQTQWAVYGAILAAIGLAAIWWSRR
ncbi:hypothetical protein [Sphingomonas echinoides]|uniref:hypothetical protein n=1 Tax=Sphingomonas echinoides TaxID=59803 RepID=UPI0024131042|nr:hypothetical protein [Sphingomonas echinoides]